MKLSAPTVGPIVGYTAPDQTRIWFRGQFEGIGESSYRRCFGVLRYRKRGLRKWSAPLFNKMSPNFDMTCVVALTGLQPETDYEYQAGWVTLDAELDRLAGMHAALIEWPDECGNFRTAAADASRPRSYVAGSCRYLLRTFFGDIFDDRGDKIFKSIYEQSRERRVDGVLMVGDQIYADDLNFFSPDSSLPEFLKRYRTVFSQTHIRRLMSCVPTYMILDDHEIEDNWPAKATEKDKVQLYPQAIHAYQIYQCSHSPLFQADANGRLDGILQKFWYCFTDGCVDTFVLDTRTERISAGERKRMLKEEQMTALLNWLGDGSGRVKLVVSSVPLAPDFSVEGDDKWGAFAEQRDRILAHLATLNGVKVVFLSGDVHCSFVAEIRLKGRSKPLAYQVVSSSFFWPYPHMEEDELVVDRPLITQSNKTYTVKLRSGVQSLDNFARLDLSTAGLRVAFHARKGELLEVPVEIAF